jgi:UTP---glucose-1-phosphate uridylyltransferase
MQWTMTYSTEQAPPELLAFLEGATDEQKRAVEAVFEIGQGPIVFRIPEGLDDVEERLERLVDQLSYVEKFYAPIGGIAGYHIAVLKLVAGESNGTELMTYHAPRGLQLDEGGGQVDNAVLWGIEALPDIAEIYAVGGAGDRFGLRDPKTGEDLPVACLEFEGRPLLEGMIRDLQGREYLYKKLFGIDLVTPIAMMTSHEKNNDAHIRRILEEANWFGRPPESFKLFTQGLVPVITKEGNWCLSGPLELVRKPGGHGVLWQAMAEAHIFSWLEARGRRKALVRQINNPVAGTDNLLLALAGFGCENNKAFGFAACHRPVGSAQGTIVLLEIGHEGSWSYRHSNIEYTDLKKRGIEDVPAAPGSDHSKFPGNSNILFVDLAAVRVRLQSNPLPGLLINMKKTAPFIDADGNESEQPAGRLETLMQNIADEMGVERHHRVTHFEELSLHTFVVHNLQRKTLSATKNQFEPGGKLADTPEGAAYDILCNHHELLTRCGLRQPEPPDRETYKEQLTLPFHLSYHPALGPLYDIIAQKLRGGTIAHGSALELELSEADIENLTLDGSLSILATVPLNGGRCTLRNVHLDNAAVTIHLEGESEFFAERVTFNGDQNIRVANGTRMIAKMEEGLLVFDEQPLSAPTWRWRYTTTPENRISLERITTAT